MIEKLLNEYSEKFGDNFPLRLVSFDSDEELKKVLENCLKSGKAYVLSDETKALLQNTDVLF